MTSHDTVSISISRTKQTIVNGDRYRILPHIRPILPSLLRLFHSFVEDTDLGTIVVHRALHFLLLVSSPIVREYELDRCRLASCPKVLVGW